VGSPPRHETPPQSHGATGFGCDSPEAPNTQGVIREESEPPSPDDFPGTSSRSRRTSTLTELLRSSPPNGEIEHIGNVPRDEIHRGRASTVSAGRRTSPPADERTALLDKGTAVQTEQTHRTSLRDIESQSSHLNGSRAKAYRALVWPKDNGMIMVRRALNPKSWDKREVWRRGIVEPVSYVPSVILGLLLNILDALSYGR
jgi:SulP family sulfate permease